jgi:hypothetical protein
VALWFRQKRGGDVAQEHERQIDEHVLDFLVVTKNEHESRTHTERNNEPAIIQVDQHREGGAASFQIGC